MRGGSGLSAVAFSMEVGAWKGPIEEAGKFVFLEVTGRPEPLVGRWSEIGARVDADLDARPIADPEFWQWKQAMQDRYAVDMSPFLELAGRERP